MVWGHGGGEGMYPSSIENGTVNGFCQFKRCLDTKSADEWGTPSRIPIKVNG